MNSIVVRHLVGNLQLVGRYFKFQWSTNHVSPEWCCTFREQGICKVFWQQIILTFSLRFVENVELYMPFLFFIFFKVWQNEAASA